MPGRGRRSLRDGAAFVIALGLAAGFVAWRQAQDDAPTRVTDGPADLPTDVHVLLTERDEERRLSLGDTAGLGGGLRVRLADPTLGGDHLGPLLHLDLRVENTGTTPQPRPHIGLYCAQSDDGGYALWEVGDPDARGTVPAGAVEESEIQVPLPGDTRRGEAIPTCDGTAYLEAATYGEDDWNNALARAEWAVPGELVDALNDARPDPPPSPAPPPEPERDPDRPYGWTDDSRYEEDFAVAFVRGMSATEVLRVLGPVVRDAGRLDSTQVDELVGAELDDQPEDEYAIPSVVVVAERDGGVVVLSRYGWFGARQLRALSRGGVAASYSNTVNGDDHVFVARAGRIVRSFDPFLDPSWGDRGPLPQGRGLDLEDDTVAASWTLLDRLTSITVPAEWLDEEPLPTYVLPPR
ncbi:DUF6461 domain-containing protein [Nocardioides sp. WV_118_6]